MTTASRAGAPVLSADLHVDLNEEAGQLPVATMTGPLDLHTARTRERSGMLPDLSEKFVRCPDSGPAEWLRGPIYRVDLLP